MGLRSKLKRYRSIAMRGLSCALLFICSPAPALPATAANVSKERNEMAVRKERVKDILSKGRVKSSSARRSLEDALENDKDPHCRAACAISLGNMGDRKSIAKLKGRLNDEDVGVRMRAAWALAKLGDKSGKALALETIQGEDVTGQLLAAEALESIGDRDAIQTLKENLKNNKVTVRWHSKVAIKKIEMSGMNGDERVEYLGSLLSSDEMNNWSAVELAQMGSERAIEMLRRVAADGNNPGMYAARKTLAKLKQTGRIP